MSSRVIRVSLLTVYLGAVVIVSLILATAVISAPVVRQVEAGLGHPLTCDQAYANREINNYFYPQRTLQGDTLYWFSLIAPFFLFGFAILLGVIGCSDSLKRLRWPLVGLGLVLFAALLIYMPVIRIVACAVE